MSDERAHLSDRERNVESYSLIKNFLDSLKQTSLAIKPTWTPEEASKIQTLSREVIPALPESIKIIKFPNGGQMIFGEKDNQVRTAEWDLTDIKKWAEHLEKTIKF